MASAQVLAYDELGYPGRSYHQQRHFDAYHQRGYGGPPPPPPPPPHPRYNVNARPDYHPLGDEYHFEQYGYQQTPPPPPPAPQPVYYPGNATPPRKQHGAGYQRRRMGHHQGGYGKWNQDVQIPSVGLLAAEVGVDDPRVKTAAWREAVVEVSFKRRPSGLYWYRTVLKPGEVVLVSADRGFDIGTVVASHPSETPDITLPHTDSSKGQFSIIFRPATQPEIRAYRELQATQEAQAVVRVAEILPTITTPELQDLKFIDAVFQFDGRKLTLYYETSSTDYKNYRPLLKPLFDTFGCRIWLQKVTQQEDESEEVSEAGSGVREELGEEAEETAEESREE